MKHAMLLAVTTSILAAAPAVGQNNDMEANNAAEAAETTATSVDANNAVAPPAAPEAAPPATETAPVPGPAPAERRSFPWGVLGLLGLIGLMGSRKAS